MCRYVSVTLFLCITLPGRAQIPQNGFAHEVEPVLQDSKPIRNMSSEQFARLSIDDPLLRLAYADLIASELMLQTYTRSPTIDYSAYPAWHVAAMEDMRRRGDAVTPVLLDIATKNPNSGLETGVLCNAPYVIKNVDPYLMYARNVLRTRTMEMDSSVAGAVAELMVRHGTSDDLERLRNLIKIRSYLAGTIEGQLRHAAVFQAAKKAASDANKTITPPLELPAPKNAPEAKPALKPTVQPTSSVPWLVIVVLIVVATGLLWLLVKTRK